VIKIGNKNRDLKNEYDILSEENQQLKLKVAELQELSSELQKQKKRNERNAGRKHFQDTDTVRRIFILYSRGKSFQQIADILNNEGIRTKTGGRWAKSSIRYIYYNEAYLTEGVLTHREFYNLEFPW